MKKLFFLTTTLIALGLAPAFAQFGPRGGGPQGPRFGGAMDQLFGTHQAFSAALEFQTTDASTNTIIMPGKLSLAGGKSRFEMNLSEMQNTNMSAEATAMMKSMGMDTLISISRPDKKLVYVIYPGLSSYAEMPSSDKSASTDAADYKVDTKELGRETVEGHNCVKNQVTVTDKDGTTHESTVWNAADVQNFPVKIVTTEQGQLSTMLFKRISFAPPAADTFEVPTGFTKYASVQSMMQAEMMKKMAGGAGLPSGQ
jgi:hypothetical protein